MACSEIVQALSIILFVFRLVNSSQVTESKSISNSPNSRQPRTMKELNMQNLPSCLSIVMCRMEEMGSVPTKNQNLLEMLLKSLMDGNKSEESSSEEVDKPHEDSDHSTSYTSDYIENYNEIYQSRSGLTQPRSESGHGSGRMFGISYPMYKYKRNKTPIPAKTEMNKVLVTQSQQDLHDIKTALQLNKGRSSSQCNSTRKARLLKLTWIRNRYPITSTVAPVSTALTAAPQMSCPYDFAELQSMLFGAFNNILMTGGGLAGAALMQQPPPKQEMPMMPSATGGGGQAIENLMSMINKDGKLPYTVYANIKLPLTISTDASEMQDKVAKLHSQQYSQMFGSDSKIPGVGAVAQKIKFADFFRRRGISAKHQKQPIKVIPSNPKISVKANSLESGESEEISHEKGEWTKAQNLLKMKTMRKPKPVSTRISLDFRHYLRSMTNTFAQLQNNFFARFQKQGFKMLAKRRLSKPSVNSLKIRNGIAEWSRFPKIYLTSEEQLVNNNESEEESIES